MPMLILRRVRLGVPVLAAVMCLCVTGCGGGETAATPTATKTPAGDAASTATPAEDAPAQNAAAEAPFGLSEGDECPISAEQASEILDEEVKSIPTPGALCGFGLAVADITRPTLAVAFTPQNIDASTEGLVAHPEWGENALFEDQGCATACTGNAWFPLDDGAFGIMANSGADGTSKLTEQHISDTVELLKELAVG
jgi:hypothetical protein